MTFFLKSRWGRDAFSKVNRYYGDGLNKLEPKDVESLECPKMPDQSPKMRKNLHDELLRVEDLPPLKRQEESTPSPRPCSSFQPHEPLRGALCRGCLPHAYSTTTSNRLVGTWLSEQSLISAHHPPKCLAPPAPSPHSAQSAAMGTTYASCRPSSVTFCSAANVGKSVPSPTCSPAVMGIMMVAFS